MAPSPPRLRILSVGGNAVSAFLSWRLQATNACDVTLVWKSGFDAVSQYGISFRSKLFGNERFKPRHVVRTPEDASTRNGGFDYVLLCVKALPDVYDLAAVIESVVTPQQTCILVNTTHTLGVESHLEQRFPTNVVLSLVSGAELSQLGASEFEHQGSTEIWVGPANKNPTIPASIQSDMAEALAMTLTSGQVDCKVSENIRQQQYEKMIGPIAFHPASVLFEMPVHAQLLEKVGVRPLIRDVVDELLQIAIAQGCSFPVDFKQRIIETMAQPAETNSIMYQDFTAKRPMEVETYLGSPIKLAQEVGVRVPRIETLYALLHNFNIVNQSRPSAPTASSPIATAPPPRLSSVPPPRQSMNGNGMRGGRSMSAMGSHPPMRRGPPSSSGYPPRQMNGNGYPPRGHSQGLPSRRGSPEANDLEEFSHLVLYDDIPEGDVAEGAVNGYVDRGNGMGPPMNNLALRERELMLRQRELQLREQEYNMRRGPKRPPASHRGGLDDDEDDDDFVDPMAIRQGPPMVDPDNFDMMSVTSRRTRKAPSASQLRKNPDSGVQMRQSQGFNGGRQGMPRNRTSARLMQDVPGLHDSLMDNPMMSYASDRYGDVDRKKMGDESRAGSLTAARLDELQQGGMNGSYPMPSMVRRTSQSPGNPYSPGGRTIGRPSPPNGSFAPSNGTYPSGMGPNGMGPNGMIPNGMTPNGLPRNGRPSPPGFMRQPVPRYPPGQGNTVAPQQVEQHAGVSTLYPPKGPPNVRSLTGSASASAGSGDSGASAQIDSENSAHSSQSSLGPRPPIGVR
ncbi:MAG: hypothetical protein M1827_001195 [Pycnora praestabilis]|nr:MAG: hypothetical protein M1827_001195 [Pycnora praestabilis]